MGVSSFSTCYRVCCSYHVLFTLGYFPGEAGTPGRAQQKVKKPHRWKPGTVALREIKKLQKTTELLIPFAPFVRLVREISDAYARDASRWTPEALLALQEVNYTQLLHWRA
ncbi:hypothetical protein HU200_045802 [Digitaria exilis]|uniref:Core Histone H2A/H2B/H3 domain-containing protein n=1 Tax=Digitaria exilis TaxID=1010633 RepID=A0A835B256_9POAL|nr:hypothetical protein HU200_050733 [Digitaria exilis]KAF8679048.1 hypothetical protein HU200_045802 [Digitaria exilis]